MDAEKADGDHLPEVIGASEAQWQSPSFAHAPPHAASSGTPSHVSEPVASQACLEREFQAVQTKESLKFSFCYLGAIAIYIVFYQVHIQGNFVPIACALMQGFFFLFAIGCHFSKSLRRLPVWIHTFGVIVVSILSVIAHPEVQYYLGERMVLYQTLVNLPKCAQDYGGGKCRVNSSYNHTMLLQLTFTYYIMFLLRFRIAIIVIAPCTMLYNVLVISFGPSDGAFLEFVIFSVSMAIILLAKFTVETSERRLFFEVRTQRVRLVHEEVLRCQAEFRSENLQEGLATSKQEGVTIQSNRSDVVTSSAGIFAPMVDDDDHDPIDALQRIRAIGHQEHWLIDASSITVFTKEVLGSGSYGVVLKGTLGATSVALKLAKAQAQNQKGSRNMLSLANELRLLRRLRHPNIVLFHGAAIEFSKNQLVLVLEFVAGETLQSWIQTGSRDLESGCGRASKTDYAKKVVLLDVSSALSYLHGQVPCIVHGDIKASNIMLEELANQPRAKLLDFGLSRLLTPHAPKLGGTPSWMAPEVAKGHCQPSPASDVFSFGRVLFFISTEQMPFAGYSTKGLFRLWRFGSPPTLLWPCSGNLFLESCRAVGEECMHAKQDLRPQILTVHAAICGWTSLVNRARHVHKESSRDSVSLCDFLQHFQGRKKVKSPGFRSNNPPTSASSSEKSGKLWALPIVPEDTPMADHGSDVGLLESTTPQCASADSAHCEPSTKHLSPDSGVVDNGPEVRDTSAARSKVKDTVATKHFSNFKDTLDTGDCSKSEWLKPTPRRIKCFTLYDLMEQWHETPNPLACCPWHTALHGLEEAVANMPRRRTCLPEWRPPAAAYQCPQCLLILDPDGEICPFCEYDAGQGACAGNSVVEVQEGVGDLCRWTL